MVTTVLNKPVPKVNAVNAPPKQYYIWNLIKIGQLVQEIFMFESVDARTHGALLYYKLTLWPSWISGRNDFSILNFYVTVMPPTKFRLNPTYGLGDVVWRISRWRPCWISERNDFSNSDSPCCHNASHQVQLYPTWVWRRCWKCERLSTDDDGQQDGISLKAYKGCL